MATQQRRDDERAHGAQAGAYARRARPGGLAAGPALHRPEHTAGDALVMTMMLAREREIVRTWSPDVEGPGISETLTDDGRHLLAVPDGRALLAAREVTAVGFFGRSGPASTTPSCSSTSAASRRRSRRSPPSGSSATSTSAPSTGATAT